jgi:FeS assembly SUF system regulator
MVLNEEDIMLRVSKLADYATIVMAYMAIELGVLHNARDIALHTHIALPTVSKILKLMARKGLLISHRGAKGGYSLARDPEEISVADVLGAIDGEFGMTDCSQLPGSCNLEAICSLRSNWRLLSHAIFQALECLTLADMARPMQRAKVAFNKSSLTAKTHVFKQVE